MKPEQLAAYIRTAGKAQRTLEFQFPYIPEVYIKLTFASKHIMNQMNEIAREVFRNPRTGREDERFNNDKLRHEYATRIIASWRGLTFAKLQSLIPGMEIKGDAKSDDDVPFSTEVAEALLEVSIEYENWVVDVATSIKNYSQITEQKAKEITENLD